MKEIIYSVEVDKENVTVQGKVANASGRNHFGGGSKLAVENIP
jgi:hypothetical protein